MEYSIRPLTKADEGRVREFLTEHWGSPVMISRGKQHDCSHLPGFIAEDDSRDIVGLISYCIEDNECEVVSLDSLVERRGLGGKLLDLVRREARREGCRRVWLITSNDNLKAIGFYQKRGMKLSAIYPDAVTEARKVKPSIPLIGNDGIPIRDEIELEDVLGGYASARFSHAER